MLVAGTPGPRGLCSFSEICGANDERVAEKFAKVVEAVGLEAIDGLPVYGFDDLFKPHALSVRHRCKIDIGAANSRLATAFVHLFAFYHAPLGVRFEL